MSPFLQPDRLFDIPTIPQLTDRQQRALDAITAAGFDGLTSDEVGAILHEHSHGANERCMYCASTGNEVGRALRAKGLVQQRRRKTPAGYTYMVWTIAGKLRRQPERDYDLPAGY
jgi:hypothetical protein